MDRAEDSVCHGVHWVGKVGCAEDGVVHDGDRGGDHGGGGNHGGSNGRGGNNSVVAKTNSVVTKTSKDDLSISISLPLLVVVSMVMVVVQGRGTGDWVVGGVDTRGALVAQGESVGESVEAVSVVGLGTPLPAAGHCGTKVVGAETNVAGVDEASRGGGNSVDGVGQSSVSEDGRGNSGNSGVVAKTVAKTSKDDLRVSLSLPLSILGSIGESSVGQGGTSAGHGQVQSVDTRGRLASEGVHAVSIGEGESGVDHVGRGDGRKRGKSNLKKVEGHLSQFVASSS